MANKMHPGAFRCYDAALPDEPMFVILGRDPAGPATLAYWAYQRALIGKNESPDDAARIIAARKEAQDMSDWRAKNEDPHGDGVATWKHPRPEPEVERPTRMEPALGMPYTPDIRAKIAIGLRQVTADMAPADMMVGEGWLAFIDRINGYALELETDSKSDGDPYVKIAESIGVTHEKIAEAYDADKTTLRYTLKVAEGLLLECKEALRRTGMMKNFDLHQRVGSFIRSYAKPVYWSNYDEMSRDEDGTLCKPLSVSRMCELLDYATAYGELDETTPNGVYAEKVDSSAMNDARRISIWTLKRCLGLIPETAEPPVADDTPPAPTQQVHTGNAVYRIPGVEDYQTTEQIAETYRKLSIWEQGQRDHDEATRRAGEIIDMPASGVKVPTVDSKPDDLAHAPEVPAHRFSVFHEAGQYAYARGLEVNPIHLPTALDAMSKSGWHLLAIFGQTDSQHIGFVFKRRDTQKIVLSMEGDPEKIRDKLDLLGLGRQLQP